MYLVSNNIENEVPMLLMFIFRWQIKVVNVLQAKYMSDTVKPVLDSQGKHKKTAA